MAAAQAGFRELGAVRLLERYESERYNGLLVVG
jgi:hypothetical protein